MPQLSVSVTTGVISPNMPRVYIATTHWLATIRKRGFVRIVSGGQSDVGQQRTNNEDCFRIVQPLNLFIISDGMGGEAHGEVASAMAVDMVVKTCMGEETGTIA